MYKSLVRVLSVVLSVALLGTSWPAMANGAGNASPPALFDPLEVLNRLPGQAGPNGPRLPNPLAGTLPQQPDPMPGGVPVAPSAGSAPSGNVAPPSRETEVSNPVDVTTGRLKLGATDLSLPGIGFGFNLQRSYDPQKEEAGAFGKGWDYIWNSLLRMYADFAMGEFRVDGTVSTYHFVKDDPDGYILDYDDDDKVNYELHKGHYEPVDGENLERVGQFDYQVTTDMGTVITYYGYYAPWRASQDAKAGKMIRQSDRYGNTMQFTYDGED